MITSEKQIISPSVKELKIRLLILGLTLFISTTANAQTTVQNVDGTKVTITDTARIVTIGSDVTETVFALGAGRQVVAVDQSSTYPAAVHDLPKVPYIRSLSAEGILALNPTLIIASQEAKPKTVIDQIRSAGVPVLMTPDDPSRTGAVEKIERIGVALGKQERANELAGNMTAALSEAEQKRTAVTEMPTVMFLLSAGNGRGLMAAGTQTSAEKMIELAGGTNVFSNFNGYKPVSSEAVATANPDVILMMRSRAHQVGGDGLKSMPGIKLTTAARNGRIVSMDGNYLLGFGPRTGQAVLELMNHLYPKTQ